MMKTKFQRTELLRTARALSTPKCTAAMFLMALLAILTFPTKTWAQEPIAKIGDTPYESLKDAFYAAADGSTVTLLGNADIGEQLIDIWTKEGEKNLTLDLNGFSLTGTEQLIYVRIGGNLTVKGGTIGGPDADNPCGIAIRNIGGKVSIENLTISNCRTGIYNEDDWPDEETSIPGELTIGSGVNISATERCIDHFEGELTLTTLPMLSWDEGGYGITLSVGQVINFAGESITALPKNFKPIEVLIEDIPSTFTSGYSTFFKNIDPADVFVSNDENIIGSITLEGGEAVYKIEKVSFPEGLSTFFSVCDLSVDNKKVKIYTVTAVEEGKVTVTEVKSRVIPSYTPVIISNESSETLFDPIFLDKKVCHETFDKDIPDGVAQGFYGTNDGIVLMNGFYDFNGKDFVWLKDGGKVAPHRCWIMILNENDDDEPVAGHQLTIDWTNGNTTDVNGDGKTDIADVVALTNAIIAGTTDLKYDINGDNQVTDDDITALVDMIMSDTEVPGHAP